MTGRMFRNLILGVSLLASASACREEQIATEEILPSVSVNSAVVKRTALTMVWR